MPMLTASDLTANPVSANAHKPQFSAAEARWRSGYAPDCKSKADATETYAVSALPVSFPVLDSLDNSSRLLTDGDPDFLDGQCRIYLIGTRLRRGERVKVGVSTNIPQRFRRLQASSPVALTIFAAYPGSFALEKRIHHEWRRQRTHGEWFRLTDGMCRSIERMRTW